MIKLKDSDCFTSDSAGNATLLSTDAGEGGFTRVELVVVLATLAMLAMALLPALARNRVQPQTTQCVSNLRQLTVAWRMYADESNGRLTPNHGIFPANCDYTTTAPNWVAGKMNYSGGTDDTNSALLLDPTRSELGPYIDSPSVFHCPADHSRSFGTTGLPRVRSYSMSNAFGTMASGTARDGSHVAGHWLPSTYAGGNWKVFFKDSDFDAAASPSGLWLLLDEHPDSINDPHFAFNMPGSVVQTVWVDYPTKSHNNACNFSFADGHVETHTWQIPAAIPPVKYAAIGGLSYIWPANPDIIWVARHTSRPANGVWPF